ALDEFAHALRLQPDNGNARYGLAVLALSQKQFERATQAFEHLYDTDQHTTSAAYYLGVINERKQAYATAGYWVAGVDGGRHEFSAAVGEARMRAHQGQVAAARQAIQRLRQRYPARTERLAAAEGQILFSAGQYAAALQVYDAAIGN